MAWMFEHGACKEMKAMQDGERSQQVTWYCVNHVAVTKTNRVDIALNLQGRQSEQRLQDALRQSRIGSRPAASTGSRQSRMLPLRPARRRAHAGAPHPSRPHRSHSSAQTKGFINLLK